MSGTEAEDGLERNWLKPAESSRATEQTRVDMIRSQVSAATAGMRRHEGSRYTLGQGQLWSGARTSILPVCGSHREQLLIVSVSSILSLIIHSF